MLVLTGAELCITDAQALSPVELPGDTESHNWILNRANYNPEDFAVTDDWTATSTDQPGDAHVFLKQAGNSGDTIGNFINPQDGLPSGISSDLDGLVGMEGSLVLHVADPLDGLETIVLQLDYRQIGDNFGPGSSTLVPVLKVGGVPVGTDGQADNFISNDTVLPSPVVILSELLGTTVHAGQYFWQWNVRGMDLSAGYTIEWDTPGVFRDLSYSPQALLSEIQLDQGTQFAEAEPEPTLAKLRSYTFPATTENYNWTLSRANYVPEDFESTDDWTALSTDQPDNANVFLKQTSGNFIMPEETAPRELDGLRGTGGSLILHDADPLDGLETIVLQLSYRQVGETFSPGSSNLVPILKVGGVPVGANGQADFFAFDDIALPSLASASIDADAGQYAWQWDLRELDLSAGYTIEWNTPGTLSGDNAPDALLTEIQLDQSARFIQLVEPGLTSYQLPGESESYGWSLNRANYPPEDFESGDDWQAFPTDQPGETDVFVSKTGANFIFSVEDSADGLYGRNGTVMVSDTAPPAGLQTIVLQLNYALFPEDFSPGSENLAPILKIGGVPLGEDGRADTFLATDSIKPDPYGSIFNLWGVEAGQYAWQWDLRDLGGLDLSAGYTIEWATPASGYKWDTRKESVAVLTGIQLDHSNTYTQVLSGPAAYDIPEELPERGVIGQLPPPTGNPNLFDNGSFETLTPYLEFLLDNATNNKAEIPATDPTDPGTAYLSDWNVPGIGLYVVRAAAPPGRQASDGNIYLELGQSPDRFGRPVSGSLGKELLLEAGVTYRFSFDQYFPKDSGSSNGRRSCNFFVSTSSLYNNHNLVFQINFSYFGSDQLARSSFSLREAGWAGETIQDEDGEFYLTDDFTGGWVTRWADFTPLVSGLYSLRVSPGGPHQDKDIIHIDNFSLTVVSEASLRLVDQWRLSHFYYYASAGEAADTADPDGDGLSNLIEYALRSDPHKINRGMNVAQTDGAEKHTTLTFGRRADPDLVYTVEATDDLAQGIWTPIFRSTDLSVLDTDSDTFVVEDDDALEPGDKRFFRLSVENTDE